MTDLRALKLDRKSALVLGGFILVLAGTLAKARWALLLVILLGFGYAVWSITAN